MYKILQFIEKNAKKVFIGVLVLTLFFAFAAVKITINADFESMMPWEEASYPYYGGIEGQAVDLSKTDLIAEPNYINSDFPSTYFVLIKGENLYTGDSFNAIEEVINNLEANDNFTECFSIFDFVTFEKKGTRLATIPFDFKKEALWTDEEVLVFKDKVSNDPVAEYFLVGKDNNSILLSFNIKDIPKSELAEIEKVYDSLKDLGLDVNISGRAVINNQVMTYLNKDLVTLIILCLLIILLIYYFTFRSKRAVLIPMSLSIIALVWTFGTMTLLGIEITILNIVAPVMVLTLGTSYAIHVLSEYYAMARKRDDSFSPAAAVQHVVKTIIFACLTTVCGFLALAISQTEELKLFGISVSIGLVYCSALSCIYLPAVLALINSAELKQNKKSGLLFLENIVRKVSKFVIRYWLYFIIAFALLVAAFFFVNDKIPMNTNYMSYFPDSDDFGKRSKEFASDVGGSYPYEVEIIAPEGSSRFFLDSANLSKAYEFEKAVLESDDVLQAISFPTYVAHANYLMSGEEEIPESPALMNMLSRLVMMMKNQIGDSLSSILAEDSNSIVLTFRHWDSVDEDLMTTDSMKRVLTVMVDNLHLLPEETIVKIDGDPIVNIKFADRLMLDQQNSTYVSLLVVFVLVLIAFLSFTRSIITIIPILAGIMINYVFMYMMNIPFDIITVSFTSIAIGCGVDDAIHFMLRYKKKRKILKDISVKQILGETIVETGKPIIITTISIVCGMLMLSFASYMPIRYFGLLMSISLFGCMVSTLIFIPPFIILFNNIARLIRKKK